MTTEEKAKAYDEALEKARIYRDNAKAVGEYSMVARYENIFSELRESEDERIRKELMTHLQQEANSATLAKNRIMWEKMLAWVEKQKYDRMKPIYDAREFFESALEKAWNDYYNGYENVDKLEDDYVECAYAKGFREGYLFGIEKQKEQSLRDFIDDFPYSDQKPIPKFKVGDRIVSTKNSRLTYEILEVGHVNELGNIEYKVEIFTDGKPDEPHNVHYMECCKVDEWGKLMEQKSIEDVIKDITKNKESAIKFLKSAGIMDDNGELAEMYRSKQKPADHCSIRDEFDLDGNLKELNYDNRIQYDSVKSGIEAFASTYSFNIESKLFPQLTKEQQQLWREEIEQAVIAGGESGIELARDYRYKENRTMEWSEDIIRKAVKEVGLIQHQIDWFNTNVFPPKQEWSEEDENMLHIIITDINYAQKNFSDSKLVPYDKKVNWLKSLRPQPKKDLSKIKSKIILALHHVTNCADAQNAIKKTGVEVADVADWLFEQDDNSSPQWKPSEEQIEALETAERWYSDNMGCNFALVSLCEQLKKL